MLDAHLLHQPISIFFTPKFAPTAQSAYSPINYKRFPCFRSVNFPFHGKLRVSAVKNHKDVDEFKLEKPDGENGPLQEKGGDEGIDLGWWPAFPYVLIASMSNFLFGYDIGVMNGPIISVAKELGFEGNSFLEGLVVSIFIGGAFIGSFSCASLVDKLGFRRTFQLDTIPLILGAIISARATSLDEILWGRFLVGLGIGVNAVLVPIYISEVAPTKYRGTLGTLCQLGTCIGIIASLFVGIPSENDPHWWRIMLYIASIPGFVLALGMQFSVESPRWLCKAGRFNDAKKVIESLWSPSEGDNAIEEFQSVIRNDGGDLDGSWLELLEEPHSRGALCASYLVDKQGRKRLLIGSYLGMAISMFLIVYGVGTPIDKEFSSNLSILGTLLYVFTFSVGAGPVTGLIIPELSSSRTRGKIMAFSFSVHWVCNFLVGLFFLELVEKFGVAPVYAGFGSFSLLAAAFAYFFIIETKGRSLEEIEMSLNPNLQNREK